MKSLRISSNPPLVVDVPHYLILLFIPKQSNKEADMTVF